VPGIPALAPGDIDRRHHGATARQLLDRRKNRQRLSAAELERWLVDAGFAERADLSGRLVATELGNQVGGCLGFLGE
jgi:hypothetical protein